MNRKFRIRQIFFWAIFLSLVIFIFAPAVRAVSADNYGLDTAAKQGYGGANGSNTDIPLYFFRDNIPGLIGKIVGAGLAFVGIVFFLLTIYGGFLWMTARGNEQQIATAKDLLFSAIIGLLIVLAAYAITAYVGTQLTT